MPSRMLAHFTILSLATASILLAHNVQTKAEDLALKDAVSMAGMQLFSTPVHRD